MVENFEDFISDYIQDLNKDLQEAVFNTQDFDRKELEIKLKTAAEIATGCGANIKWKTIQISLPLVVCDWEDDNE